MRQNEKSVSPMSCEGRNKYVIDHITASLMEMLKIQPLNEISISELCAKAGVGRASFYRNFQSKEDIIKKHLHALFYERMMQLNVDSDAAFNRKIKILFSHFVENKEFYEVLYKSGLIYLLKDVLVDFYGPTTECSAVEAYSKAFVTYSLFGWIEIWFQRGMKESPSELEKLFQHV